MSTSAMKRALQLIWRAGGGWILMFPAFEIATLMVLGGIRDRGRFVISPNSMLQTALMPMVMAVWAIVGQYHVRLMVSATETRVPRVTRNLCFTVVALAAWTIIELLAPIVVLGGQTLEWLLFIFFSICSGVLAALFRSTYLEMPIWLGCVILIPSASVSSRNLPLTWIEILAVILPILIAWRIQVLIRAFRAGSHGDFFKSFAKEAWGGLPVTDSGVFAGKRIHRLIPRWWRTLFREGGRVPRHGVDRSSPGTVRACLGPLHSRGLSWLLVYFGCVPLVGSFGSHISVAEFLGLFKFPVLFGVPIMGGFFVLMRARRLADVLGNPSGEIADLILLPGLGGRAVQKRALLQETLFRPLIYYGLCLSVLVGVGWVLEKMSRDPVELLFLTVPSSAVFILLLFALATVGVLSGKIVRGSRWLDGVMILPMCFFGLASISTFPVHGCIPDLLGWRSIVWVGPFSVMAGLLTRWGVELSRRENLLCR